MREPGAPEREHPHGLLRRAAARSWWASNAATPTSGSIVVIGESEPAPSPIPRLRRSRNRFMEARSEPRPCSYRPPGKPHRASNVGCTLIARPSIAARSITSRLAISKCSMRWRRPGSDAAAGSRATDRRAPMSAPPARPRRRRSRDPHLQAREMTVVEVLRELVVAEVTLRAWPRSTNPPDTEAVRAPIDRPRAGRRRSAAGRDPSRSRCRSWRRSHDVERQPRAMREEDLEIAHPAIRGHRHLGSS